MIERLENIKKLISLISENLHIILIIQRNNHINFASEVYSLAYFFVHLIFPKLNLRTELVYIMHIPRILGFFSFFIRNDDVLNLACYSFVIS